MRRQPWIRPDGSYRSVTLDAHTDIEIGEGIFSRDENGLVNLDSKDFRLDKIDGGSVDTNQAFAFQVHARERLSQSNTSGDVHDARAHDYDVPSFFRNFARHWLKICSSI
jgi:hypothetical protein